MKLARPQLTDPGLTALKTAVRAAIVMPAVFAVASQLIQQPQASIFASFGSFAILIFVDFAGPPRTRLTAYLTLAAAGAVLVVLGSLCSRNAWLAAAAMAVVGFAILFAGVFNGYLAAGGTAAILAFVLAVSVPAPPAAIPWRLAGWGLASAAGICAVMLLWPPRQGKTLREEAARACLALADLAAGALATDQQTLTARSAAAGQLVSDLRAKLQSAPHRPTGPTGPAAALAALIDELHWLLASLQIVTGTADSPAGGSGTGSQGTAGRQSPATDGPATGGSGGPGTDGPATGGLRLTSTTAGDLCRDENAEAMMAAADVLRACAARLRGGSGRPDTGRLMQAQERVVRALGQRISRLPRDLGDQALESLVGRSFRIRAISYTTRQIAAYALAATGAAAEAADIPARSSLAQSPVSSAPAAAGRDDRRRAAPPWRLAALPAALQAIRDLAAEDASSGSVWLRNSVRGAAGLAIAVFIAQRADLQHSFWVVLGTLSVLRSNALGTGRSVVSALAGTAAGIVVGAAILIALGASDRVLWGILPAAVLVAAYAPRVISFAAGQAAFTVVLVVLFNIIQPTGWKVGLIRIEDVAIGFAVSLGVGLLFWPRGAAAVLRRNLAAAYSHGADYVAVAAWALTGGGHSGDPAQAGQSADTAVHRLDDAFRQYLAERSVKRMNPEGTAVLVAGARRVLRAGRSLDALSLLMTDGQEDAGSRQYGTSMDGQIESVRSWYVTLADSLANRTTVPRPQAADPPDRQRLMHEVRDYIASGDAPARHGALLVLWASEHLDILRRLEGQLADEVSAASAELPG
jgi:uncharacterized membrane protein YccC